MKLKCRSILLVGLAVSLLMPDLQAAVVAYPEKKQSEGQQNRDKADCAQWATQQTGISPEQLLEQQAPSQSKTGPGSGAASGAAVGAAGGAIAGNAGAGAGTGAAFGVLRRHHQEKEAQQKQQAGQVQTQQQLTTYENAQRTCLKGKGYTVN